MTKHVAGFILFTFIVAASGIIAALFYTVPSTDAVLVKDEYITARKFKKIRKKHCRMMKRDNSKASADITLAIFDSRKSVLTASIDFEDERKNYGSVDLHFFVSDRYGTRFLKTERMLVSTAADNYDKTLEWMGRLEIKENLYVIAEARTDDSDVFSVPDFDHSKAMPILILND